jgi:hypothetical protein
VEYHDKTVSIWQWNSVEQRKHYDNEYNGSGQTNSGAKHAAAVEAAGKEIYSKTRLTGYSKFWRQYLPRLKYHNPDVPMEVIQKREIGGPATLVIEFSMF